MIATKVGWINMDTAEWLFILVGAATGVAYKHAIKKADNAAKGAYHMACNQSLVCRLHEDIVKNEKARKGGAGHGRGQPAEQ